MIRPLRKRHRMTWLVLLVIISILFVKSYQPPQVHSEENANYPIPDSLTFIENVTTDKPYFKANLGTLSSGEKVLQLNLKVPFDSPAPAIYLIEGEGGNMADYQFIGDIIETGDYQFKFEVSNGSQQLIVYDPIKKIQLETINFQ